MRHIAPVTTLVERLPPGLCDRLLAMPVRRDPRTGTIDVAVVDARDPHPAEEIGYWLKAPVRMVRTSIASMESALLRLGSRLDSEPDLGMRSLAAADLGAAAGARGVSSTHADVRDPCGLDAHEVRAAAGRSGPGHPADPPKPRGSPRRSGVARGRGLCAHAGRDRPAGDRANEATRRQRSDPRSQTAQAGCGAAGRARPRLCARIHGARALRAGTARRAGRAASLSRRPTATIAIIDQMRGARDRDQILDFLVAGARTVARRAVVLAVRRDALVGWTGSGDIAERSTLRAVRLPNSMPTVFHEGLERRRRPVRSHPTGRRARASRRHHEVAPVARRRRGRRLDPGRGQARRAGLRRRARRGASRGRARGRPRPRRWRRARPAPARPANVRPLAG